MKGAHHLHRGGHKNPSMYREARRQRCDVDKFWSLSITRMQSLITQKQHHPPTSLLNWWWNISFCINVSQNVQYNNPRPFGSVTSYTCSDNLPSQLDAELFRSADHSRDEFPCWKTGFIWDHKLILCFLLDLGTKPPLFGKQNVAAM